MSREAGLAEKAAANLLARVGGRGGNGLADEVDVEEVDAVRGFAGIADVAGATGGEGEENGVSFFETTDGGASLDDVAGACWSSATCEDVLWIHSKRKEGR